MVNHCLQKPRGLWRPAIVVKISVEKSSNPLNINPHLGRQFWKELWNEENNEFWWGYNHTVDSEYFFRRLLQKLNCPCMLYCNASHHDKELAFCSFRQFFDRFNFFSKNELIVYPELRKVSNYQDVCMWLKDNIVVPAVKEYRSRIEEALFYEAIEQEIVYERGSENLCISAEFPNRVLRKIKA